MVYVFDSGMARKYGVEEAIILHNLAFWILKNEANGKHFRGGKTWTYNSVKAFRELFPFWTEKQIRRILASLEKQGAIQTAQFEGYDRTTWYSVLDQSAFQKGHFDSPNRANGSAQTGESLTDKKTRRGIPRGQFAGKEEPFWKKHV